MNKEPTDILRRALEDGSEEALADVGKHAEEITELLREEELEEITEEDVDPKNLEGVFDELHKALRNPRGDVASTVQKQLEQLLDSERASLGEAFAVLTADLDDTPASPRSLIEWIRDSPAEPVSERTRAALQNRPDVKFAPEPIRALTEFGVTPVKLYRAIKAIPDLIDSDAKDAESVHLTVSDDGVTASVSAVNEYLLPEVASFSGLSLPVAEQVTKWVIEVAAYKNYVFPRYAAAPHGDGIVLSRETEPDEDLAERWKRLERTEPDTEPVPSPVLGSLMRTEGGTFTRGKSSGQNLDAKLERVEPAEQEADAQPVIATSEP